ncbi:MAG: hypothetical protein U0L26_04670 [Cellulosilyticum sp.]|nr:hypothetical protein [Cellulosilyticum sp.]
MTRTYALRQYENIKPMVEIEIEFDTETDKEFDMQKTLEALKIKCEDYIKKFNPEDDSLPF